MLIHEILIQCPPLQRFASEFTCIIHTKKSMPHVTTLYAMAAMSIRQVGQNFMIFLLACLI